MNKPLVLLDFPCLMLFLMILCVGSTKTSEKMFSLPGEEILCRLWLFVGEYSNRGEGNNFTYFQLLLLSTYGYFWKFL